MLNLTDIAQRIAQPHLCSSKDAEDLRLLCEKYPYSQVFPLLYLSVLAHSNDVHFDQELTKHAYKISDRTRLYDLISEKDKGQGTRDNGQVTDEEFGDEEIVELLDLEGKDKKEEGIEDDRLETKDPEGSGQATGQDTRYKGQWTEDLEGSGQPESLETKEELVDEEILEQLEVKGEKEEGREDSGQETEDKNEALEQKQSDEVKDKKEEGREDVITTIKSELPTTLTGTFATNEDSFQDEITAQTIAASYSLEQEELRWKLEKTEDDRQEAIDPEGLGQASGQETFDISSVEVETSKQVKETTETENIEDEIVPSSFEKSVEIESKKSFSSWLHANENYTETKEEKVEINDLIAKFIEDSPKISQPNEKLFEGRKEKKEFFSPTKKAKESLSEHQLPVSETLAKIFAAQGNFPKAIFAYEQLMLIIPEKKIFFANQIKELQKKLNQ